MQGKLHEGKLGSGLMKSMLAGDPTRADVAPEDMTWTVRCDDFFTVSATNLAQQPLSFGYLVRESDRHEPEPS